VVFGKKLTTVVFKMKKVSFFNMKSCQIWLELATLITALFPRPDGTPGDNLPGARQHVQLNQQQLTHL
jgi:hypothetical protein